MKDAKMDDFVRFIGSVVIALILWKGAKMNDFVRFIGSVVIALVLMSIPGLLVASFVFEWHAFLKALLCMAAIAEYGVLTIHVIYERSEK